MESYVPLLIGEFFIVTIYVLYLLLRYPALRLAKYDRLAVYSSYATTALGWIIAFSVVILIPLDIQLSADHKTGDTLHTIWEFVYWGTIITGWIAFPLLSEYERSGGFTIIARIKTSLKINILFFGGIGILGVIFLVWLSGSQVLVPSTGISIAMALSNTWGLLFTITLLGYGLVEVPRTFWRKANHDMSLMHCEFKLAKVKQDLQKTKHKTAQVIEQVHNFASKTTVADNLATYLEKVLAKCPLEFDAFTTVLGNPRTPRATSDDRKAIRPRSESHIRNAARTFGYSESAPLHFAPLGVLSRKSISKRIHLDEDDVDATDSAIRQLSSLHRQLKSSVNRLARLDAMFNQLMTQALKIEDIIDAAEDEDKQFVPFLSKRPETRTRVLISRIKWFYYVYVRPLVFRIVAVVCGAMSVIIVFSEVFIFQKGKRLAPLYLFTHIPPAGSIWIQVFVVIPLWYMVACSYSSLLKMKLFNYYHMVKKGSDATSMLFSQAYLTRLIAPLGYNYLLMIKDQGDTQFSKIMGEIESIPLLGLGFNVYFPIFVLVLCLFTMFNVYSRVATSLNFKTFTFEEEFDDARLTRGREILQSTKHEMLRQFSVDKRAEQAAAGGRKRSNRGSSGSSSSAEGAGGSGLGLLGKKGGGTYKQLNKSNNEIPMLL